jgi:hypothetical protein
MGLMDFQYHEAFLLFGRITFANYLLNKKTPQI